MVYDFSSGFQTSPTEAIIFAVIFGLFAIVFIVGRIIKPKPKPKKIPPIVRRRVDVGKERIELSEHDQMVVRRLAWVLKNPRNMNQMIDDHALFRRAAHRAIREGIVAEQEVLRFARRLDIDTTGLSGAVHSTRTIAKGAHLSISDGETAVIHGSVVGMDQGAIYLALAKNPRGFTTGTAVEVVSVGTSGMHRFQTRVVRREKKEMRLMHADRVSFVQRRRFHRRRAEVAIDIAPQGLADTSVRTKTEDLSLGGAAVPNPRRQFNTGDQLECRLYLGKGAATGVPATVIRTSRKNRLLHLQFGKADEKAQFAIFRYVYTGGKNP